MEEAKEKKAAQKVATEAKDAERKARHQELADKTRDHFLVKSNLENDNKEAAIQNALKFLQHPMMMQSPDEQKLMFLVSKGFDEAAAKEALIRAREAAA